MDIEEEGIYVTRIFRGNSVNLKKRKLCVVCLRFLFTIITITIVNYNQNLRGTCN